MFLKQAPVKRKVTEKDPKKKLRKYDPDYISFGFTCEFRNGEDSPQCVICGKILANESMLPNKLKRHLSTSHATLVNKPKEFFVRKLSELQGQKAALDTFSRNQTPQNALLSSYKVAYRVAKCKKPHTIAEELILPSAIDMVTCMLGEKAAQKIKMVPLSNNTLCRRIEDMAVDINEQLVSKLRGCEFAIQLDEATDSSMDAHLICYVRFVCLTNKCIIEDLLFCKPITSRCRGIDMFEILDTFFKENDLVWENLVGICTDGARSMSGKYNGLQSLVRDHAPHAKWTHCMIHRESLAANNLSKDLSSVVDEVVKVINYVKTRPMKARFFRQLCDDSNATYNTLLFHATSRWLTLGNSLARVYILLEVILQFLETESHASAENFKNECFLLQFSYLCDIFEKLNNLNTSMQGRGGNILEMSDKIDAFVKKIIFWKNDISSHSGSEYFSCITRMLSNLNLTDLPPTVSEIITGHLNNLESHFQKYFTEDLSCHAWVRNPFLNESPPSIFNGAQKEEFIDLSCDNNLKCHMTRPMIEFWMEANALYPCIAKSALRILIPFATSYLCEAGFSAVAVIKTKYRSKINVERELRLAISDIQPRYDRLCARKQAHVSH